jgi:predicted  nucleic acid-binding Zn-ribbon protein
MSDAKPCEYSPCVFVKNLRDEVAKLKHEISQKQKRENRLISELAIANVRATRFARMRESLLTDTVALWNKTREAGKLVCAEHDEEIRKIKERT